MFRVRVRFRDESNTRGESGRCEAKLECRFLILYPVHAK